MPLCVYNLFPPSPFPLSFWVVNYRGREELESARGSFGMVVQQQQLITIFQTKNPSFLLRHNPISYSTHERI
jgi:hypothetical protein